MPVGQKEDLQINTLHRFRNAPEATPVLLAASNDYAILAAARALRAAGYAPWLALHQSGASYAARSSATAGTVSVPDPTSDGEGFARQLAAASARLSAVAVLPGAETHLRALADRDALFAGVAFGVPSRERVERATDKEFLSGLAASAGFRTPPTTRVMRGEVEAVGAFGFPAILKPLRSSRVLNPDGTVSSPYTTRYVPAEGAKEAVKDLPEQGALVQPYIPGQLIGVGGVSWEGELVCAVHQLSVRIWPAYAGGSSYALTIEPEAELEEGIGRLLGTLGWSGLFQAQFIRAPSGEHYLIDFNPRVYGSLSLAVAAGMNLPGIWVELLLGGRPRVDGYRVGTRWRHEEREVRALGRMVADGEGLRALKALAPHRGTDHAIFSLRDPMPTLTSLGKLAGWLGR